MIPEEERAHGDERRKKCEAREYQRIPAVSHAEEADQREEYCDRGERRELQQFASGHAVAVENDGASCSVVSDEVPGFRRMFETAVQHDSVRSGRQVAKESQNRLTPADPVERRIGERNGTDRGEQRRRGRAGCGREEGREGKKERPGTFLATDERQRGRQREQHQKRIRASFA